MRRRGQNHVIDFRDCQQLFVAVEPGETVFRGHAKTQFAQIVATMLDAIGKDVRQRQDLDVFVFQGGAFPDVFGVKAGFRIDYFRFRPEHIQHGAAAAPAATNHPDANRIVRGRVAGEDERKLTDRRRAGAASEEFFRKERRDKGATFMAGDWGCFIPRNFARFGRIGKGKILPHFGEKQRFAL
jgi:hypothetical protein